MKITQLFDFSDNPIFKSVTGLLNKTWDAANIVSGRAATEDQLKVVADSVVTVEHLLISADPNIIITTKGTAGVEDVFTASEYGQYNHVEGFVTGEDKIHIPLEAITAFNPASTLTKGPLPAERYGTGGGTPVDGIGCNEGVLFYNKDDGEPILHLLTLNNFAEPANTDIEIV